ncbi:MAG: anthranilate synthase component I [Planctomycetota bacterium]
MFHPSIDEFKSLAERGNPVPVYRQLLADALTPVSAFQALASGEEFAFLLESVEGGEQIGRYSFLGAGPLLTFRAGLDSVEVTRDGVTERRMPGPGRTVIDELEDMLSSYRPVRLEELPRFSGGAVGYFSYDIVRLLEPLGEGSSNTPPAGLGLPDVYFMLYDTMVIFDHVLKVVKVVCHADCTDVRPEEAYAVAQKRIDGLVERLRSAAAALADDVDLAPGTDRAFESSASREEYTGAVKRTLEYIRAGDIIQAVLSQRLSTRTRARPFDLYRALRTVNPSPYMFYLQYPDVQLVGSSPEVMLSVEDGVASVRPIAGTRPRGGSPEEDARLAEELRADPKERAEHAMLLDLGRNDVGRVADYGSVKIAEQMVIERYSHVMHLVSHVDGKLKEGLTAFDALKSCLPAGTLSGAPKVRAMQIIDELEPTRRGPYGGAVGYIDFFGNLDTAITIRTIVIPSALDAPERDAYVQAGAGIVADSNPESEYQECLNKAKALLRAIELAEKAFAGAPRKTRAAAPARPGRAPSSAKSRKKSKKTSKKKTKKSAAKGKPRKSKKAPPKRRRR